MKKTNLGIFAAVAGALLLTLGTAKAQNTFHEPSSLVLTFQSPGSSSSTLTVALGNVSTFFRDAAPGSFSSINVTGLGTTLSSTFGSDWASQSNLWMGGVGFRGTSAVTNQLLDQDPHQTLYFTKMRDGIGSVGLANSATPSIISGAGTPIVGAMGQVKGRIEALGTMATWVGTTSGETDSFIDDNNPFVSAGVQGAAYSQIGGGVQDNFGTGTFTFGTMTNVVMTLDLYRVQTRNEISGQYGFGQPINTGQFLGTLALDQSGNLGFFAAVPEPSTVAMFVIATLVFVIIRRRKAKALISNS